MTFQNSLDQSHQLIKPNAHVRSAPKARAGVIKEFTGISDPYERPTDAELTIDTTAMSPEECVQQIILYLEKEGYIGPDD